MTPRVSPLPGKEWPPEMLGALAPLRPDNRRHPAPPKGDPKRGRAALGMFAHHPALASGFFPFNGHILWDTTLEPRQRHLLILRVAALRRATYLQQEHHVAALHAGLSEDEIARIEAGPDAPGWDELDVALLRAVDDLVADGGIADETWHILEKELDVQQLADVVFTVGCYETTSFFFRSFGLEADGA